MTELGIARKEGLENMCLQDWRMGVCACRASSDRKRALDRVFESRHSRGRRISTDLKPLDLVGQVRPGHSGWEGQLGFLVPDVPVS